MRSTAPRVGSVRRLWRRFRKNRFAYAGGILFCFVVLVALLAPVLAPRSPFALDATRLLPPGRPYWLGTDNLGRDVFAGVIHGTRTSLTVGLGSTLVSLAIGLPIGLISGYYGGRIDDLLMRVTEVMLVLPRFFVALLVVAFFGANIWFIVLLIGFLGWAELARLARAEVLSLRSRPFAVAAVSFGTKNAAVILKEILPNALPPVIVAAALQVGSAILLEAGLGFLGLGDPNVMSWGTMLSNAQRYFTSAYWMAVFPGLAIFVTTFSVYLLADGLNDVLNPRSETV